jgi:hypothetical protein
MKKWERIDDETTRLSVHGGWVVAYGWQDRIAGSILSTCFVPDENHEWKLGGHR